METEYLDYWYTMAALGALRTIDEVVDGMKRLPAEVGGVLHGRVPDERHGVESSR